MDILLQAFILGAIGGIVPGAVLTILLVSALQGGLKAGTQAFFWAMLSEVVIAGGLLLIATKLPLQAKVFSFIGLIGSVVLLYFAWQVFQLRSIRIQDDSTLFTPLKIFLLSATNAPLYIFWITICFPLIWQLANEWTLTLAASSYFILFEIGWSITTFIMLLLFVFSRKVLTNEHIMHKVFILVSLLLAGFGIRMLIKSIGQFV